MGGESTREDKTTSDTKKPVRKKEALLEKPPVFMDDSAALIQCRCFKNFLGKKKKKNALLLRLSRQRLAIP